MRTSTPLPPRPPHSVRSSAMTIEEVTPAMNAAVTDEFWTPLGVRLRVERCSPGTVNWLFFPGGPGLGSESLIELVSVADLPGTSWLVDLPGDGSNEDPPGAPPDPYALWPHVLLEAVDAVPDPVAIGHSTGGEYLLSVPGLEARLAGLVLISTAPDAGWMPTFRAMSRANPLPGYLEAEQRYEADPTPEHLRDLAVAAAAWNFEPAGLAAGRGLLSRVPYRPAAVEWSTVHFDQAYVAAWFPRALPTLIISGAVDRIVDQSLWDDPFYRGAHVTRAVIEGAGHWPWLDRPAATGAAIGAFVSMQTLATAGPRRTR